MALESECVYLFNVIQMEIASVAFNRSINPVEVVINLSPEYDQSTKSQTLKHSTKNDLSHL